MNRAYDVFVFMRRIELGLVVLYLVIPEEYVWEFVTEFNGVFSTTGTCQNTKKIKFPDDCKECPNGWHVKISIGEDQEKNFDEFLQKFCDQREIFFRERTI